MSDLKDFQTILVGCGKMGSAMLRGCAKVVACGDKRPIEPAQVNP